MKHSSGSQGLRALLWLYPAVTASLAAGKMAQYVRQNRRSRSPELGEQRLSQGDVTCFCPWPKERQAAEPSRGKVKLWYFPAGKKPAPYVIFLPGGAYLGCNTGPVVFPCAAEANQAGYHAFVLSYRVRCPHGPYAPIEDLAEAIRFIEQRADDFSVIPGDYLLVGFSAGGNLAGLFADGAVCAKRYGLPQPGALALAYPWVNIQSSFCPSGSLWEDGARWLMDRIGTYVLLGHRPSKREADSIRVHRQVKGDFPPTYLITGDRDYMVPHRDNAQKLVEVFKQAGIPYRYRICRGLTHGFGLGSRTTAQGWLTEALDYWRREQS